MKAAKLLHQEILKLNPTFKIPKLDKWALEMDRLHRIDKRPWEEIERLILWSTQDAFWCKNVLSPDALRRGWDKINMRSKPIDNKGSWEQKNRQIASMIKHHLEKTNRGKSVRIYPDGLFNPSVDDSARFDLPVETFKSIVKKWYGVEIEE